MQYLRSYFEMCFETSLCRFNDRSIHPRMGFEVWFGLLKSFICAQWTDDSAHLTEAAFSLLLTYRTGFFFIPVFCYDQNVGPAAQTPQKANRGVGALATGGPPSASLPALWQKMNDDGGSMPVSPPHPHRLSVLHLCPHILAFSQIRVHPPSSCCCAATWSSGANMNSFHLYSWSSISSLGCSCDLSSRRAWSFVYMGHQSAERSWAVHLIASLYTHAPPRRVSVAPPPLPRSSPLIQPKCPPLTEPQPRHGNNTLFSDGPPRWFHLVWQPSMNHRVGGLIPGSACMFKCR